MSAPTQAELDALPADRRLELLELQRQRDDRDRDRADAARERRRLSRHQWINSGVLLIGTLLAGGSLLATAATLRTGRGELRTARESQVTDRYTKAAEQLASGKREVRIAAIYALERIAADSPRDRVTIRDLLAAYVREHDLAPGKPVDLVQEPDTDAAAALIVLTRRPADPPRSSPLDLHQIRVPSFLPAPRANLTGANLDEANLPFADLGNAELSNADLIGADLRDADLTGAVLSNANLIRANLRGAHLTSADLRDARLHFADLSNANVRGADLSGANLTGVKGTTETEIRRLAKVDSATTFP